MQHQDGPGAPAEHQIGLPITNLFAALDRFGPVVDRATIRDRARGFAALARAAAGFAARQQLPELLGLLPRAIVEAIDRRPSRRGIGPSPRGPGSLPAFSHRAPAGRAIPLRSSHGQETMAGRRSARVTTPRRGDRPRSAPAARPAPTAPAVDAAPDTSLRVFSESHRLGARAGKPPAGVARESVISPYPAITWAFPGVSMAARCDGVGTRSVLAPIPIDRQEAFDPISEGDAASRPRRATVRAQSGCGAGSR